MIRRRRDAVPRVQTGPLVLHHDERPEDEARRGLPQGEPRHHAAEEGRFQI